MVSSIVIHAGGNKTGSSAIQAFLALNHRRLRQEGVVVPDDNFRVADRIQGYHVFGFKRLIDSPADAQQRFEAAIDELAGSVDARTILLSAENLAANPNAPALFEDLAKRFDVRLIMYIRRQDDYLLSTWRQWYFKVRNDFWAWLLEEVGSTGDWRAYLERWESVVPRERIRVRTYERPRLIGGDIIDDFYSQLGLAIPLSTLERPAGDVNPSLSDAITNLVRANPSIFKDAHDNEFQHFVVKLTGDRYLSPATESILTLEQRLAILKQYQASNQWVRQHYFPDQEEPLFEAPASRAEPLRADELEEQLSFLTELIYQMYRQLSHGEVPPRASARDGRDGPIEAQGAGAIHGRAEQPPRSAPGSQLRRWSKWRRST